VSKIAKYGSKCGRLRRSVIGIVVSYAVAIQSIITGFPGIAVPVNADENLPALELCHGLNGDQSGPAAPAGLPGHTGGSHCIFCYAGSHLAVCAPPRLYHHILGDFRTVDWALDTRYLSFSHDYLIAQPRGPPPIA
jgi:hypothetical protein